MYLVDGHPGDNNNTGTEFISYIYLKFQRVSKFGRYGGNADAEVTFCTHWFQTCSCYDNK